MIKSKTKLFLVLFLVITLLSTAVFATEETPVTTSEEGSTTEGSTTVDENEIEQTDRFFVGDDIEIKTLINGNVFAIGKNVTVTGQIAGDLFVLAEKLTIDSTVIYGNLFVTASEVSINGQMFDIYACCDTFYLDYDGYTDRDLRVIAPEVTINGRIARNAYVEANHLTLESDAILYGKLDYTAQSEAIYKKVVTEPEEGQEDSGTEILKTEDTTTIPKTVIQEGAITFTKREKSVAKNDAVKKAVDKIIKDTKINSNTSEDEVKTIILANVLNSLNVKTEVKEIKEATPSIVKIPVVVFAIETLVIVALVAALVLTKAPKKDKTSKIGGEEKTKKENE